MNRHDFYFDLPAELIAQYPLEKRSDSRLLSYSLETKQYGHHAFKDIASLLRAGDLLVMNDSKVIPARLYGHKPTGGKVELLIERLLSDVSFLAHVRASKALPSGMRILLEQDKYLKIIGREEDLFVCQSNEPILELLNTLGRIPLPLYINRPDESLDKSRYQTIFAKTDGSVAAPTAGLHFDETVLESLAAKGVKVAFLTLHVGAGTFKPVRCEKIQDHKMHFEYFNVSQALCEDVWETKRANNRVIAVGTTALRSLESAALGGRLSPTKDKTDIFIYPGYRFNVCDGLLTNFHLPESTLLMLVSAFIGHQEAMALYQEAIAKRYRFFSYGDTSLLL